MRYININGSIVSADNTLVHYSNSMLRNGKGLFETMLMEEEDIALWPYHMERLFTGLQRLGFAISSHINPEYLKAEILQTTQQNSLEKLCRIRLQVFPDNEQPILQYIVECFTIDRDIIDLNQTGLTVGLAPGIQKANDNFANLKAWNIVLYETAVKLADDNKWDDVLIYNSTGNIIESTRCNVFWIKDGSIYTPPLSDGCVAGTMRKYLLERVPGLGYTLSECPLTKEILKNADAVFLSNAIRRIKWARFIGETEYDMNIIPAIYHSVFP